MTKIDEMIHILRCIDNQLRILNNKQIFFISSPVPVRDDFQPWMNPPGHWDNTCDNKDATSNGPADPSPKCQTEGFVDEPRTAQCDCGRIPTAHEPCNDKSYSP